MDFVRWFDQLGMGDVDLVGGKNASLGEMYQNLTERGVNIPNGFAITADTYFYILEQNNAKDKIRELLGDLDTSNMHNLQKRGRKVRALIRNIEFPKRVRQAIVENYQNLCEAYSMDEVDVAVRSSATAEDLPDASFAGQQETYLNVKGERELLEACKKCFASLFTNRAISYREDKGFNHFNVGLSVGVQKMVRSDKASSGVMFSIDTESGFRDVVFITGAWGLGENVVKGAVNPDEYYVHKPTLKEGHRPIVSKKSGSKEIMMVYDLDSNQTTTKDKKVPKEMREKLVLNDEEVLQLAEWACEIEEYYSEERDKFTPMDMEWAKDGETGELFIVQARPETVHSQEGNVVKKYHLNEESEKITMGQSVGERIGSGNAKVIKDPQEIDKFEEGEVLVTDMTDPDWEPIMKMASAIVTNRGGRTCHAAIISRELGIPCIVGTENGTKVIDSGNGVTIDCSQGEEGVVWRGLLDFDVEQMDLGEIPSTETGVMVNIGNPEQAFKFGQLPHDGVGLAREEFITSSNIGVHPLALLNYDSLEFELQKQIEERLGRYDDKKQFFIEELAQGIGTIAAAFYPEPVIVRMSDFKSNEYADLIGGECFEPDEENPMLGWRGASRYYSDEYSEAFSLECEAFKKVINEFGLDNVKVMIPFVRTPEEGRKVIQELESNGLNKDFVDIIAMCEIPSNILRAEEFLEVFDGFSIGSNDLTQLILGIDRDSGLVSDISDERDPAVLKMITEVIEKARSKGKYIGICGQAPSDFPFDEFGKHLVDSGISSISLNPDKVVEMIYKIADYERDNSD